MTIMEKRRIKKAAKKLGFYEKGDFLIRYRSRDVVSGLVIDRAPSSIYIWTFLLPAFDDIEFMHMSLGSRVSNISVADDQIDKCLDDAWDGISPIKDAEQLMMYLDAHGGCGEYGEWVRFICRIRLGKFDEAEQMLDAVRGLKSASIPQKLSQIEEAHSRGGWRAVQDLMVEWSSRTGLMLSGVPIDL